jgi:hypothetical protein
VCVSERENAISFSCMSYVETVEVSCIARVLRRDSPPTRSRRSTGSGGESSSMLTSVEGNAVQAFSMLL